MEKQTAFIKVKVKDRIPSVSDYYHTNRGIAYYSDIFEDCIYDDVEYWLEEIELPSEEEIEQASNRYYFFLEEKREKAKNFKGQIAGKHPDMLTSREMFASMSGFVDGVKFILNKLKGENK